MSKSPKQISQAEATRQLCNDTMYALQHAMFRGEDSHYVERGKAFLQMLRDDMMKLVEAENKAATEAALKPVDAVTEAK